MNKAVFTLRPVPYRILANRSRRVDFTVRRVHTASASRPVVTQLHVLNSWHISYFPGHVSIVSRVDHVLSKETWTQIRKSLFCCHLFYLYVAVVACNGEGPG